MHQLETIFSGIGGEFVTNPRALAAKVNSIKAYVFDWDGVFNNSQKEGGGSSNFNEADSMGTNLLRFCHYLQYGKLPVTAIISGEKNKTAFYLSTREHFNSSYYKTPHKVDAVDHLCKEHNLKYEEVAFVFDDVLDLSVAAICGLRILVNRKANPLFKEHARKNNLVDYITGSESGNFAVRESCELLMGLSGNYDRTVFERTNYTKEYLDYIEIRNSTPTRFFTRNERLIIEADPEK
ncbi:MAG: phosphatase [Bacteroidia bacterium]